MDITDIFQAIADATTNNNSLMQATQGEANKTKEATIGAEAAQIEQQAQQRVIDQQQAKAALETQQVITELSTAIGGNPKEQNYRKLDWARTFQQETDAAIAKSKQVEQLDAVSFFDNPLAYIPNQLEADNLDQQVASHEQTAKIASEALQKMNMLQMSGAEAAIKTAETVTKETQAAQLKMKAAEDLVNSNKLQIENASKNVHMIDAMSVGNLRAIELNMKPFELQKSEEAMSMHRQQLDMAVKNFNLDIEMKNFAKQEKERQLESEQQVRNIAVDALARTGNTAAINQVPEAGKGFQQYMANLPKDTKEAMQFIALNSATRGYNVYGNGVGEATFNLDNLGGGANMPPETKKGIEFLANMKAIAYEAKASDGSRIIGKGAKKDAIIGAINIKAKPFIEAAIANAESGIYAAPPLGVLSGMPEVIKTPMWQKVFKPLVENGDGDSSFQAILDKTNAVVESGDITRRDQLEGISTLAKYFVIYNNKIAQLPGLGLPVQESYNVRYGDNTLDISKKEQLAKILLIEATAQKTKSSVWFLNKLGGTSTVPDSLASKILSGGK